jgi:hypothetical protein
MVFEINTASLEGSEIEYEYPNVSQEEFIEIVPAVLIFSYVICGLEIKKRRA